MRRRRPNFFTIFIIVMIILSFGNLFWRETMSSSVINYTNLTSELEAGNVTTMTLQPNEQVITVEGELQDGSSFTSYVINDQNEVDVLTSYADKIPLTVLEPATIGFFGNLILSLLPIALIIGFFYLMMKNATGANDRAMSFGKNRARREVNRDIKLSSVAGYDEEKEELKEIVDFLKNPTMFNQMGARIPKGVLLVGPPGTGKTLLAKSIAGEAKVPFYSVSGSDFVEMFVGVGASRVREMFKEAKKNAPCLIFIDEIDAVGRQRGAGMGGGNDEREQTLNQMLVEMDGFTTNSGIVIIAATNRPDVLDSALLRPGRFDRQVTIGLPDLKTREKILKLHGSKKKIVSGIDVRAIARKTQGFSGADLENAINEAAIIAVRQNKKEIDLDDISEGIDRVIAGPAKKTRTVSEKERKLVAYHESGHVIIGLNLDNAEMVEKVTIVPRGQAGGYAMMVPKEDKWFQTKQDLLDKITGLLGGRAAEEIFLKEVSTGAHNDFERASKIARAMVTEYGMSKLGPRQFEHAKGNPFLGRDFGHDREYSEQIAYQIDEEVNRILDEQYKVALKILKKHKKDVNLLAKTLLDVETIDGEEILYLMKNRKPLKRKTAVKYTKAEITAIHKHQEKIQKLEDEIFQKTLEYNNLKFAQNDPEKGKKLEKIENDRRILQNKLDELNNQDPIAKKKVIKEAKAKVEKKSTIVKNKNTKK